MFMKKLIFTCCLSFIVVQSLFAWGMAVRDVSRQTNENPAYYLGDQVTLYWYVNNTGWGASCKKAGIGTTNSSAGMNWQDIIWDNKAGDGDGYNEGVRSTTFTVNTVSTWYYSLWLGWNISLGENGKYYNGSDVWTEGNTAFQSSSFTVAALSDPTSPSATAVSNTQINLGWTKWNSKNVMIVRRLTSAGASTAPTQGTAYTVGNTLGTGTVVYNSDGTNFNGDSGLLPGTDYTYVMYSENYSYYSPGTTVSATTTAVSSTSDNFRSKTTGNWSNTTTWESTSDNVNWINATLVPDGSARVTVLSGHTVTLDQNAGVSALTINTDATFVSGDATPRTLTVVKSTAGSAATLTNNGTWTNGTGGSTIVFTGAPPAGGDAQHSISGTIVFQNITINKSGGASNVGASFGVNSSLTGTLEIGTGGYISTDPPIGFYGATAILKFNQGTEATYDVNSGDRTWSTTVIPNNITISSGTVSLNNPRTAIGNLIIDGGTLSLAADLTINGNWTRTSGSFIPNTYTVTLAGTTNGNVNITSGGSMYNLVIDKTSGAVATLLSNLTVTNALTIHSGSKLTLDSGKTLSVNTFNINSSSDLGTGTFVDMNVSGGLTVTGKAYVQQFLKGVSRGWWYVASPVTTATAATFDVGNSTPVNKLWYYVENGNNGPAYTKISTNSTTLTPGTGYVVSLGGVDAGYTFEGNNLNNTGISIPVTRTGTSAAKRGFNLIGNPYPSYLNWGAVDTTYVLTTIWYRSYSPTANSNAGGMVFDTYNGKLNVAINSSNSNNTLSQFIPPLQAFWVKVRSDYAGSTAPVVTVTNSMRSHKTPAIAGLLRSPKLMEQRVLRLQVSNGSNDDQAVLVVNPNASNSFDDYDSPKMSNDNTSIPEIYMLAGSEKVAINGISGFNNDEQMPLGFTTGESNTFTIKAIEMSDFDKDTKIVLRDNLLNAEQDLTNGATYSFASDIATTTTRFSIVFKSASGTTGLNSNSSENTDITVFRNANNQVVVTHIDLTGMNGRITVCNAIGQKLVNMPAHGTSTVVSNILNPGVYLVSVTVSGRNNTKKVVIY